MTEQEWRDEVNKTLGRLDERTEQQSEDIRDIKEAVEGSGFDFRRDGLRGLGAFIAGLLGGNFG